MGRFFTLTGVSSSFGSDGSLFVGTDDEEPKEWQEKKKKGEQQQRDVTRWL